MKIADMTSAQYAELEAKLSKLQALLKGAVNSPKLYGLSAATSSTLTSEYGATSEAMSSLAASTGTLGKAASATSDFMSLSSATGKSVLGVGIALNLWSNYTTDENAHHQSRGTALADATVQTGVDTVNTMASIEVGAEGGLLVGGFIGGPPGALVGGAVGAVGGAVVSFFTNNVVNDVISSIF
jgi:hypothetical protein